MPHLVTERERWQDWTHPDFFAFRVDDERRFMPLFLRQLSPGGVTRTRLTIAGWILIVVAFGIGTAAYNAASNILFMTLSLLLSGLVLSGVLSSINFRRLELSLESPRHLRVGEPGAGAVLIENRKRIFPTMSLSLFARSSAEKEMHRLYMLQALDSGKHTKLEWTFVPSARGPVRLGLHSMQSRYPFGLINRIVPLEVSEDLLVWPERIDVEFAPATSGHRQTAGVARRSPGMGTDLMNLRNYVSGDAPPNGPLESECANWALDGSADGTRRRAGISFVAVCDCRQLD